MGFELVKFLSFSLASENAKNGIFSPKKWIYAIYNSRNRIYAKSLPYKSGLKISVAQIFGQIWPFLCMSAWSCATKSLVANNDLGSVRRLAKAHKMILGTHNNYCYCTIITAVTTYYCEYCVCLCQPVITAIITVITAIITVSTDNPICPRKLRLTFSIA